MKKRIALWSVFIVLWSVAWLAIWDWYGRGGYETPSHYVYNVVNQWRLR